MARRAAKFERAGALTPRDRMWAAMRALKPDFSAVEVACVAGDVSVDAVLTFQKCLVAGGYLEVGERRFGREVVRHRLIRDTGVATPRLTIKGTPVTQGIGRQRMWQSMRILREFDYRDLAELVSDDSHAVSPLEAQTYVKHLCRAGYLVACAPAVRGRNACPARYRFVNALNTGPRAPLITRNKEVMDTNTGQIVWPVRREATDEELGTYDFE